jgi:hypothetical protein
MRRWCWPGPGEPHKSMLIRDAGTPREPEARRGADPAGEGGAGGGGVVKPAYAR